MICIEFDKQPLLSRGLSYKINKYCVIKIQWFSSIKARDSYIYIPWRPLNDGKWSNIPKISLRILTSSPTKTTANLLETFLSLFGVMLARQNIPSILIIDNHSNL